VNYQVTIPDANAQSAPSVALTGQSQPGSGGGDTTAPAITAPTTFPANGAAPRFQVNPGAGRYYAVEASTNSWYFTDQYSAQRNDNNFYASWKVMSFQSSVLYPAAFELSADVCSRLRDNATNGRLYYRMWWTESPTQWVGHGCTTPNSSGRTRPALRCRASSTWRRSRSRASDGAGKASTADFRHGKAFFRNQAGRCQLLIL
jgi:hypothetical protein